MTSKQMAAAFTVQARGAMPEITITTPALDLMNDTIDPMGMDVDRYMRGTRAVLFAHDSGKLPVARTVALTKTPQGIRVKFQWLENDSTAAAVRNAFEQDVLGASVGFVVIPDGGAVPNDHGGWHYKRSVLTEWSLTGHPANPECVKMLKSLGLWRDGATKQDGFEIQTVIFPKKHWDSAAACRDWLREHDFRSDKLDETDASYRFRQADPGEFERLRTVCLMPREARPGSEGCRIEAVGGPLKERRSLNNALVLELEEDGEGRLVDVEMIPRVVRETLPALVGVAVGGEMGRMRWLFGGEPMLELMDGDEQSEHFAVDPEALRATITDTVRQTVGVEVRKAINRLRGRVD